MTRAHDYLRSLATRHLEVDQSTVEVVALGYEGSVWSWPLGVLVPDLVRYRLIAVIGEEAALIAARGQSAKPVKTLWRGPVSGIEMGKAGPLHTPVYVGGHRVLMQSPARKELAAVLNRRAT